MRKAEILINGNAYIAFEADSELAPEVIASLGECASKKKEALLANGDTSSEVKVKVS